MRSFLVIIILFATIGVFAQAGRVKQETVTSAETSATPSSLDAEKMFREANEYARAKFAEFEQKKLSFSEALRVRTVREQKELAAQYAARLAALNSLKNDDFYYLGMLYWISGNLEATANNLDLFIESAPQNTEKLQTARSILTIIAAGRKDFPTAENLLRDYLTTNPVSLRERARMENDLAKAYYEEKKYPQAAAHAEEGYRATKALFQESGSRARGLAEILDSGETVFEIYRESGNVEKTDWILEDLRKTGAFVESTGIYYFAVDNMIKYMIETKRKPEALAKFKNISAQLAKDFPNKPLQEDLSRRFKRRDKHYALLGETAPEMRDITAWLPNRPTTLEALRGKVVLLDFWATWCGPCIDTFPTLKKLYAAHQKDGFEIVGLTRYYGQVNGENAPRKAELDSIQKFKKDYDLPYGFAIADNQLNQITYGATAIPTAVVIDRQGIIRYIESGTNSNREKELEEIVLKILAEKR